MQLQAPSPNAALSGRQLQQRLPCRAGRAACRRHAGHVPRMQAAAVAEQVSEDKWIAHTVERCSPGQASAALASLQQAARAALKTARMPTTRNEAYRYTDLSAIVQAEMEPAAAGALPDVSSYKVADADRSRVVLVDGVYNAQASRVEGLPAGVVVGMLSSLTAEQQARVSSALGSVSARGGVLQTLNGACASDVVVLFVPKGVRCEAPIHLLHVSVAAPSAAGRMVGAAPRALVVAEANSVVTLIEEFAPADGGKPRFVNAMAEVVLAEHASMSHVYVAHHHEHAVVYKSTFVSQAEHSSYALAEVSLGAQVARHDVDVLQLGPSTATKLYSFLFVGKNSLVDLHSRLVLDHPEGTSDQLHKCIVAHSSARGVFDGNVQVNRMAQRTDAGQLSRNLLLAPRATVNVKPNLQIIADDVKCTHGCTVSDLEDEELFYFRARGIDAATARAALVYSFGLDVVQEMPSKDLQERVRGLIRSALDAASAEGAK